MSICLAQFGEALSPDAVPELLDVKATTQLDDAERLTVRSAELASCNREPPQLNSLRSILADYRCDYYRTRLCLIWRLCIFHPSRRVSYHMA